MTARRTDIHAPEEGGYVWVGRDSGARQAWTTLVINDNEVLGQIQTGGRLYRIEPVAGRLHRIIEINQDKIRDDLHLPAPAELQNRSESDAPAVLGATTTKTTINVMVAHTANARREVGTASQMQARINLAISLANQAFTNSGVKVQFVRVGGEYEVSYDGNLLAHEVGHNMGLQHDRAEYKAESGNTPSNSRFNFGYVDKAAKFFDIMAYRSSCGTGCTRAPYFSTPLKKFPDPTKGRPLGIPQNFAEAADAARTLNATRTNVSSFC